MPRIGVGTEFLYAGRNLKIDRRKEDDPNVFIVIDEDYNTKEEWSHERILAEHGDKNVVFPSKWDKKSEIKNVKTFESLPEAERDIIEFRYYCVKPLLQADPLKPVVDARVLELQEEFKDTNNRVCRTNLYEWRKTLLQNDGDKLSLGTSYPRGKGTGKSKLKERVVEILEDVIQKHFLGKRGVRAATICKLARGEIIRENRGREPNSHLKVPDNSTIYRMINSLDAFEKAKAQYGYLEAFTKYGYVGETEKATRPMQFVQADHSPIDVLLVDDKTRKRLPRAYLTVLIDVFSGYVVGFHVTFRKPSYRSVMLALLNTYTPNKNMKEQYPDLKNDWYSYGLPEVLFVDNGKEFHSHALKNACFELGIELVHCKVKQPWHKPVVENFFLTKNHQFDHLLFGTTHANNQEVKKRDNYNPADEACIGFEKYVKLFYKWLLDAFNNRVLDRITDTPMDYWQAGVELHAPRTFSSMERLQIILLPSEKRKVTRGVIRTNRLQYRSPEIYDLFRHIAAHCPDQEVVVKHDPDDVSHIYVYDFVHDRYLEVLCDNAKALKGVNAYIYALIKNKALNEKREISDGIIAEAFVEIMEEAEEEKARHKALSAELANRMDINSSNTIDQTEIIAEKVKKMEQEKYVVMESYEIYDHEEGFYDE